MVRYVVRPRSAVLVLVSKFCLTSSWKSFVMHRHLRIKGACICFFFISKPHAFTHAHIHTSTLREMATSTKHKLLAYADTLERAHPPTSTHIHKKGVLEKGAFSVRTLRVPYRERIPHECSGFLKVKYYRLLLYHSTPVCSCPVCVCLPSHTTRVPIRL